MLDPVSVTPRWLAQFATGWAGLIAIFVYSVLVAAVLPFPGELVLFVPLDLGIGRGPTLALIIFVSAVGKAIGSVATMEAEQAAESAAADGGYAKRLPGDYAARLQEWMQSRAVDVARKYGYAGLALLLAVPGSPDTVPIYAFGALERDAYRFAAAAFVGTVLRLLVTLALVRGVVSVSHLV